MSNEEKHHVREWREYRTIIDAAKDYPDDTSLASLVRQYAEARGNGDFVEAGLVEMEVRGIFEEQGSVLTLDSGSLLIDEI